MAVWILSGQNLRGKQEKEGKWKKKKAQIGYSPPLEVPSLEYATISTYILWQEILSHGHGLQ